MAIPSKQFDSISLDGLRRPPDQAPAAAAPSIVKRWASAGGRKTGERFRRAIVNCLTSGALIAGVASANAQEDSEPGDVRWAIAEDAPSEISQASLSQAAPLPVLTRQPAQRDPALRESAQRDPALRESAQRERASREPAMFPPPTVQPSNNERAAYQTSPVQPSPVQQTAYQDAAYQETVGPQTVGPQTAAPAGNGRQAVDEGSEASSGPVSRVPSPAGPRARDRRSSNVAPLALVPSKRPLSADPRSSMNASDAARGGTSGMGKSSLFAALALVLGGTAGVLWLGKRGGRARRGRLPAEVFEQLGKASLSPKLEAYLLRVGGKLVLVGVHAGEANPLTEITDPVEVQRIIAACAAGGPAFVGNSLADVPATFASETGHSGTPAEPTANRERLADGIGRSSFAASLRRSLAQLETRNA